MGKDKLILGENAVYSIDSTKTGVNNNIIICGSSGSGKTMSIIEPRLLYTSESSLIVTVSKRRVVDKYKDVFRQRGYEVYDMNFTNPESGNVGFDPLEYVESYSDIKYLSEAIVNSYVKNPYHNGDPYWNQAAASLLAALITYSLLKKGKEASLVDALEMLDCFELSGSAESISTSMDKEFSALAKKDPTNFAVTSFRSIRNLPPKTAGCVYGSLRTAVDAVFTPEIRQLMMIKPLIDFKKLAKRKTALFITTSAVNPSMNNFVNLFYSAAFKKLFEYAEFRGSQGNYRLPLDVHCLYDDFAVGGRVSNFAEYISIFREKGISVTMLLQSESQLQAMYGSTDATTIINNSDTYVYLGSNDLETARNISQRCNKPLEDVLSMEIGKEIIFRRGQKPLHTERYNLLEDERYQEVTSGRRGIVTEIREQEKTRAS